MSKTFVGAFIVTVEDDDATVEQVKDFLNEALTVDLDTEEGNDVQAVSAQVLVEGLVEETTVDAEYTSQWETGETLTSACKYRTTSKICFDISEADECPDGSLVDEWVTLPDRKELRAEDGVTFDY